MFTDERAAGQLIDGLALDGGIEVPIKILQGLTVSEAGFLAPFLDESLTACVEFILEDQLQELFMGDGVGGCLLEAQLQTGQKAGEAESADGVNEVLSHKG